MKLSDLRWTLRVSLMFFFGVVPAIVLLVLLLVLMPLAGIIPEMLISLAVVAILALLGIVGLWGATFRDEQERVLPNGVTIALVLVGLLPALPYLVVIVPTALEDGGFFLLVACLLIGPVICGAYFLVEQAACVVRRRSGASTWCDNTR